MTKKILVVEDDPDLQTLLAFHLKREGYEVESLDDGLQAHAWLQKNTVDLALFDWQLPGMTGIDLCRHWSPKVPILMITARDHAADIVLGLESGAQDYITKPFEAPVLLARVRAVLKRSLPQNTSSLESRGFFLDHEKHLATWNGQPLPLSAHEFKLLGIFLSHRGKVLTRAQLIGESHGKGWAVSARSIDTAIYELRKKLGPEAASIIETVRSVGYRIQGS